MTEQGLDILKRRAGVLVPLSALRRRQDWGVGDIACLRPFMDWMREAGLSVLNLLPLNDLAPEDSCPYTALSAFALDPVYVSLDEVPELRDGPELRAELSGIALSASSARMRKSRRVRFAQVRDFKMRMLESAHAAFEREHLAKRSSRAFDFEAFCHEESSWLGDYALFRVLKEQRHWASWLGWGEELRDRRPEALQAERERNAARVRFYQYVQWVLAEQWFQARQAARERGILLYGDIPFGLNRESSDVWARQADFDLYVSMGAPPDQYSATGQAWGLPAYRWTKMEAEGNPWWRQRVREAAGLYDLFRLDHAVGFFRTWFIRSPEPNGFDIKHEADQKARGERFFRMTLEEGSPARPVAEDLGVIPPFVHEVLKSLKIPGYRVTRWEHVRTHVKTDAGTEEVLSFRDPKDFPPVSLATTGNHDTTTLAVWWGEIEDKERDAYWKMVTGGQEPAAPAVPTPAQEGGAPEEGGPTHAPRFSPKVHERILENVYRAGSSLVILPFQDLFGTRERVNVPGLVDDVNWTYRVPWEAECLLTQPRTAKRTAALRRLAQETGRLEALPEGPKAETSVPTTAP